MPAFVFWKYDRFPYVLGDEAEQNAETLKYRVPSYQFTFNPNSVHVMPLQEGKAVMEQLEALREEYRRAEEKLHGEFIEKRNKIAPFLAEPLWKHR